MLMSDAPFLASVRIFSSRDLIAGSSRMFGHWRV